MDAPVLSNEQKLRVIIAHREDIRAMANFTLAQERAQAARNELMRVVDAVGVELGIGKAEFELDIEALALTEKKKA